MYQNPYMNYQQSFNQQSMNERIDNQIAQLQQMKEQMKNNQQQPAINQTFQLAPTHASGMRYANSLEDVNREMVYIDTPFFSKDMSVVWVKNNKNEVKSYELKEIVPMDSKDMQIQYLQSQIEELKGMIKNESNGSNVSNDDKKQNATDTTTNDGTIGTTVKKSKSSSISKVSTSKEE